ncbi:3'-5'-exoribonuclease, partial [Ascosphaera pollenicola]
QEQEDNESEDTTSIAASLASATFPRALKVLLDPAPTEHSVHTSTILAAAVVGYMSSSDELTEVWVKGNIPPVEGYDHEALIDGAVECARAVSKGVVVDAVRASAERRWKAGGMIERGREPGDVEMEG